MAHEKLRPHYFFDEAKIEQLKQIAPECFEDGKINFETLKQNLGDWAQDEEDPELEHFGLFWPGKRDARKAAALPPEGALEPVWGDGLKADGTPDKDGTNDSKNVFIEGENLEVLKLLQKSYAGKIKMIYIDPPYNTGNDFVYDDDFTEPLQEYLRRTGQVDEEGKALTTNKRSDGRFHSKWLSMMYPRLRLARNLLHEKGAIFISIDDNEVHNLHAIMNEIFGEENFVAKLIWQKKTGSSDATNIAVITEYILVFAKQIALLNFNQDQEAKDENRYRFKDEYLSERGQFYYDNLDRGTLGYHESLDYGVEAPDGSLVFPNGRKKQFNDGWRWKWGKDKLNWGIENGFIEVQKNSSKECGWGVYYKIYLNVDNEGNQIIRSSPYKNLLQGILNTHASNEAKEIFGKTGLFSNPKPSGLIKKLLVIGTEKDDIILDFFSGSATSAHATLELNREDQGQRQFICIQIPELTDEKSDAFKAGYKKISDVSIDRIKKVSKILKSDDSRDIGCKVLSLKQSNYKNWLSYKGNSISDLESKLSLFNENPLQENYTKDGLLTEIILLEGFSLCSKIFKLEDIKSNDIKKVTSKFCNHSLLICLDDEINKTTVSNLKLNDDDIFICLDSAISTEDKLRLSDQGLIKTI